MLSTDSLRNPIAPDLTLIEQGQIWDMIRRLVKEEENDKLRFCLMDTTGGIRTYFQYHLLEHRYCKELDSRGFLQALGDHVQDYYLKRLTTPQEILDYTKLMPVHAFMNKCRALAAELCPLREVQIQSEHERMLEILSMLFGPVKP